MNREQLVATISEQADVTKAVAGQVVTVLLETVTNTLAKGEDVVLVGFGTFTVKERAARTGRNPQTGAPIAIKAAKIPSLKIGSKLKDAACN